MPVVKFDYKESIIAINFLISTVLMFLCSTSMQYRPCGKTEKNDHRIHRIFECLQVTIDELENRCEKHEVYRDALQTCDKWILQTFNNVSSLSDGAVTFETAVEQLERMEVTFTACCMDHALKFKRVIIKSYTCTCIMTIIFLEFSVYVCTYFIDKIYLLLGVILYTSFLI